MMDVQRQGLLTLVRSGLTGEALPLPEGIDLEQLYPELVRHQVTALGYLGAVNCGISKKEPVVGKLFQAYCLSLDHSERQQKLVEAICAAFDRAGVDYMPLKGCNLKGMYPAPELRAMGDADILIRVEQYDRIQSVLPELGFVEKLESDHELVWRHSDLMLELHKRLIPSYNKDYYRYFGDGWQLATIQNGTRWSMKREDELVYLFTHFAKHYRSGGIGLRHLADLWVFLRACPELDFGYIQQEMKKLQLSEFYTNVAKTLDAWLGEGEWDEVSRVIVDRVCGSGAYGKQEDRDMADVAREAVENKSVTGTRLARVRKLVFQPLAEMKKKYPVLEKLPILLPVFWVVRIFVVLLFRRSQLKKTAEKLQAGNARAVSAFRQELDLVGLNFNFEE